MKTTGVAQFFSSMAVLFAGLSLGSCGVFDDDAGGASQSAPDTLAEREDKGARPEPDLEILAEPLEKNAESVPVPVTLEERKELVQANGADAKKPKLDGKQVRSRLRSFADQYRNEISAACDEIKANREDPRMRRLAHAYKLDGATAAYDIAVEDDARQAVLDMLVLVTLQWYVAESHGSTQFPKDHALIKEKTQILKNTAWNLAAQVMTEKQRGELLAVIDRWWAANGNQTEVWYVRIADLAGYGSGTSFEGVFSGVTSLPGKFLNAFVPLDDASESLGEASVTAERAVWLTPRLMILAQWRAEMIILDSLATTEVSATLGSVNKAVEVAERATAVAEQLPEDLGVQREALIRDLVENEASLKALLEETRATIDAVGAITTDTNAIVTDGKALLETTDSVLRTADTVVQSVESMLRAAKEGGDETPSDEPPGRPFDITEYNATLQSAEAALNEINQILANVDAVTASGELRQRVEPVIDLSEDFVDDTLARVERLVIVAAVAFAAAGIAIVGVAKFVPSRRRSPSSAG